MTYQLPEKVDLGRPSMSCLGQILLNNKDTWFDTEGKRTVMGYVLPKWQRGFVWTDNQSISLIESIWKGIPIGTFTYNSDENLGEFDGFLVDGQQRIRAIELYITDQIKVFGGYYSELSAIDKRKFASCSFPSYICSSKDESYLKDYYNLMNFGGVEHKQGEEA